MPDGAKAVSLVDEWLTEYPNAATRRRYGWAVQLIADSLGMGAHPERITARDAARWLATYDGKATNTTRQHLVSLRLFLRWCAENELADPISERAFKRLIRSYPQTYGKVEGHRKPNRMNVEAFERLCEACHDGTDVGLRDEVLIRLAVAGGVRVSELITLTVGDVANRPAMSWLGKARKQRTASLRPELVALINAYLQRYARKLGREIRESDPLICRGIRGSRRALMWGCGFATRQGVDNMLQRRASAAGLAAVAPHDLKRSTARMLHEARSADGGHIFDLVDIADVLDHSNPLVTDKCYIGPLGSDNKRRAAEYLG